jgi:hypothetical protein
MDCCDGLGCAESLCVEIGTPDCGQVNQSNECSDVQCQGNGCKKKKKKRGKKRGKRKSRR